MFVYLENRISMCARQKKFCATVFCVICNSEFVTKFHNESRYYYFARMTTNLIYIRTQKRLNILTSLKLSIFDL